MIAFYLLAGIGCLTVVCWVFLLGLIAVTEIHHHFTRRNR